MPLMFGSGFFVEGLDLVLAESGTGADAFALTLPLSEHGTGLDQADAISKLIALPDAGTGSEGMVTQKQYPLVETGSGADSLAGLVHLYIREIWVAYNRIGGAASPVRLLAIFSAPAVGPVALAAYLSAEEDRMQAIVTGGGTSTIGPKDQNRRFSVDLSALASIGTITAHSVSATLAGADVTSAFVRAHSLSGYTLSLVLGNGTQTAGGQYNLRVLATMNNSPASVLELDALIDCAVLAADVIGGGLATIAPQEANIAFRADLSPLAGLGTIASHTLTASHNGTDVTSSFIVSEGISGSTLTVVVGNGAQVAQSDYVLELLLTYTNTPATVFQSTLTISCTVED